MNMNGIYANQTRSSTITRDEKSSLSYEKGQIIEGIISKVSDQVSINFSGRDISFPKETVRDAKEGEIRQFQIMDISRDSIVLKEVGSTKGNSESAGSKTSFTTVYIDPSTVMGSEEQRKNEEDNKLEEISGQMTEENYKNLSKEGLALESFDLKRLEAALARIKNIKLLKQNAVENQVEQLEKMREFAKETARNFATNSIYADEVANRLVELDLPVTVENIERMLSTMDLAKEAMKLDDASCSYLIENQLEPTAQNIYKAVHSRSKVTQTISDNVWSELKDAVEGIIEDAGLAKDDKSIGNARWLISRELPVNEENLKYKQLLDKIKETDVLAYALSAAAAEIQCNYNGNYTLFQEENHAVAKQVVRDFSTITDRILSRAIYNKLQQEDKSIDLLNEKSEKLDLNLEELNAAKEELLKEDINTGNKAMVGSLETSLAFITAKRQLEEIRLKLTVEAGNRMLAKGIRIDTESLVNIVEELKNQEDSYYKALMQEVGIEGEDNLSLLKETSNHLTSLKEAPNTILGATFSSRTIETISSLTELGLSQQQRFKEAGESYEALMTRPRSDMGDSIQKAFLNIDAMLENMNMEPTKANARAVRILAYNNIDINESNITSMKLYDAKVNALFENLTPSVTASLIKEGINPLQMPIDELNQEAEKLKSKYGVSDVQSFAEYLVSLEDNKEISKEERASYVGIYRLLHQVEKSDGAAIGSLVKANQEITLNNLMTAIRTKQHGNVDTSVDDNFGEMVSKTAINSITDQVNTAFASNFEQEKSSYQNHLVSKVRNQITPERLADAYQDYGDAFGDTSLEKLSESFEAYEDDTKDLISRQRMEQMRELSKNSMTEQQFLREFEIPDSIHNIIAAGHLNANAAGVYQDIKLLKDRLNITSSEENVEVDEFTNALIREDTIQNKFDELQANTQDLLTRAMEEENIGAKDLELMNRIQNTLNLTLALSKKEYYNIPVSTQSGILAMNLTIIHGEEGKGQVKICYPSETKGKLRAELLISDGNVKCFVTAQSKEDVNKLKQQEQELINGFKEIGLGIQELYFDTQYQDNSSFIFKNGSIYKIDKTAGETSTFEQTEGTQSIEPSTNELYLAAKAVVTYLKKMDSDEL